MNFKKEQLNFPTQQAKCFPFYSTYIVTKKEQYYYSVSATFYSIIFNGFILENNKIKFYTEKGDKSLCRKLSTLRKVVNIAER